MRLLTMRAVTGGLVLAVVAMTAGCGKDAESTATTTATALATAAPTGAATAAATATASAAATVDPAAAAAAAAEQEKAAEGIRMHHRHHHHGGVAMFIHMAIDSLGVAPEKKAQLEKIQATLHASMAPSRDAGRNVLSVLADGVAAGKIDQGKLDAAIKAQDTASAGVHAATQDALNQLHEALSPAERQALVDKVEAHAEVWKKVSLDEETGSKEKTGRLAALTKELGLTADQEEKISAALKKDAPPKPDPAAIDAHIKAFATAFVADKFDAKTLATANAANAAVSKHGTARTVRFYKIVTPLLTPEQRTKLAEHLRERLTDKHAAK
jgi:Spy/CpxP family protein refolding chaperone